VTEDDAKAWVADRVDPSVFQSLERFAIMIVDENTRQNLISPGTVPMLWSRHIADSLQLMSIAASESQSRWLDIGSGGGFPGMVLAIAGALPMTMVEPRKRRVAFLRHCLDTLGVAPAVVIEGKIETASVEADVITARAVASVEKLLLAARHCCTPTTRWLLPRGAADIGDLQTQVEARGMMFHVEQSVTETSSSIVVLEGCPT